MRFINIYCIRRSLFVLACTFVINACSTPPNVIKRDGKSPELVRLQRQVNSNYDEFAPQLTSDASELVFTSNRPLKSDGDEIDRLYRSRRSDEGLSAAQFSSISKDVDAKAGAVAYDFVNKQVYFVQCYLEDGFGDCDLYVADVEGFEWKNIRNLGPEINSIEWDAHPTISRDGETLYFASERSGDSDIWQCKRMANGNWSSPVNLGEPVNTGGDEKSPFISNDDEFLFFSSDAHPGYGELDLFRSQKRARGWSEPKNLGVPYNSVEDDVFLTMVLSGDTTYLASNRSGGLGGFDVYEIRTITLKKIETKPEPIPEPEPVPEPIPEPKPLTVRYTIKNAFTGDPIHSYVKYRCEGEQDIELQSLSDGIVQHEVIPGKEYTVTASSSGFESGVDEFFFAFDESGLRNRTIFLTPITEDEQRIYSFVVEFDFDLFNIRPEERKHLDSVGVLLTKYPNSKVVATGHTDSVGTINYNVRLGFNRARAVSKYVVKYLRSKGVRVNINPEIRTYGKSYPVATNSTEEGRQRNRRVEISLLRLK